ncbi:MAG TPA: ABC transporter ATP-binding protein [Steroidobacteraceae bacterium]|jgi:ABC-2 type transport system ATP-binding protein|nr:ABC transporter ATP-binding protein [Steroidobacteraceae bacterium]
MPVILEARNLVKHYGAIVAVDGVSFGVEAGTCFGLLGPNGAGKTTTVEMIEGILPATSGEVFYRGESAGARFRAEAGIQFQKTALQEFLTVRECLTLFRNLYPRGLTVDEVIRICALEKLEHRDNRKLSGGQLQRLLLAIALVNDPEILFLDEPTTGLDPQARHNFWDLVRTVKASNKTVILTTHYMEEAYFLCDVIAIMDHGRIIAMGSPLQLLQEHFEDVILEMPREDFTLDPGKVPFHLLDGKEQIEISTASVDATLKYLMDAGVSLRRLRIRPRNLEDLFLELTGKELRA